VTDSGDLKLFTVDQAATLCKVSAKTVYRAIWQGRLRASRLGVGAAYRITLEDIQDWIEGSTVQPAPPPKPARRLTAEPVQRRSKQSPGGSAEGRLFLPGEMDGSA
jgi:excisionase family DNA binding protein